MSDHPTPPPAVEAFGRKPNHDIRGRAYRDALAVRATDAKQMIAEMCSKGRGPRMSIPAGDLLHARPCGDEDLFITDLIDDLLHALLAQAERCRGVEGVLEEAKEWMYLPHVQATQEQRDAVTRRINATLSRAALPAHDEAAEKARLDRDWVYALLAHPRGIAWTGPESCKQVGARVAELRKQRAANASPPPSAAPAPREQGMGA